MPWPRTRVGISASLTERPEVVLADLNLPDCDDLELTRELKRDGDCEVILMTGRPCEAVETKAAAAGISPVLAKPVELAELARAIERAAPNANGG